MSTYITKTMFLEKHVEQRVVYKYLREKMKALWPWLIFRFQNSVNTKLIVREILTQKIECPVWSLSTQVSNQCISSLVSDLPPTCTQGKHLIQLNEGLECKWCSFILVIKFTIHDCTIQILIFFMVNWDVIFTIWFQLKKFNIASVYLGNAAYLGNEKSQSWRNHSKMFMGSNSCSLSN